MLCSHMLSLSKWGGLQTQYAEFRTITASAISSCTVTAGVSPVREPELS